MLASLNSAKSYIVIGILAVCSMTSSTGYPADVPDSWVLVLTREETDGFLERYVDVLTLKTNQDGNLNYWIWVNYFELGQSLNDLIEVRCDTPLGMRTLYRRNYSDLMGQGEESSFDFMTDWIFPPEDSNYSFEIKTVCNVAKELNL